MPSLALQGAQPREIDTRFYDTQRALDLQRAQDGLDAVVVWILVTLGVALVAAPDE